MNKSLQSVLENKITAVMEDTHRSIIGENGLTVWDFAELRDALTKDLIHSIADLLEGEGSRIIGEDEVISMEMALGKNGKDFKLIEMNRNKLRAEQKAHLAEVVADLRSMNPLPVKNKI